MYCHLKSYSCSGILPESQNLWKYSKQSFLCLLPSSCLQLVSNIRLEPTQILFKWPYSKSIRIRIKVRNSPRTINCIGAYYLLDIKKITVSWETKRKSTKASRTGTVSDPVIHNVINTTAIAITVIKSVTRTNTVAITIGESVAWATFHASSFTLFCHIFLFALTFVFLPFAFRGFPLVFTIFVSCQFWHICLKQYNFCFTYLMQEFWRQNEYKSSILL